MATLKFDIRMDGVMDDLYGRYLVSYDPEHHLPDGGYDGGDLQTADDRERALVAPREYLLAAWRSGPTCACHRTRPWDGQPNRPLTAYCAVIED